MNYVQALYDNLLLLGEYDLQKVGGLSARFFWERRTFLDCRGDLQLSSHNMTLGLGVKLITQSHDFSSGQLGPVIHKRVHIYEHTFVGSFSVLYNCVLEPHTVVACGSVVRNMTVPTYTMVEGNPAQIIKEYKDGKWIPVERKYYVDSLHR